MRPPSQSVKQDVVHANVSQPVLLQFCMHSHNTGCKLPSINALHGTKGIKCGDKITVKTLHPGDASNHKATPVGNLVQKAASPNVCYALLYTCTVLNTPQISPFTCMFLSNAFLAKSKTSKMHIQQKQDLAGS